ncbi:YkgJ family cysteine cluster protein [Pseudomonas sp. NA-150]|uniref:YkgJ family cysteine cluster protein n=1 Tax=Pseudomonas sp. NA-150 TaxID=3367525 RepID=UPI0037CB5C08
MATLFLTIIRAGHSVTDTRFSCVGCGKCCNDHHVPLTLSESRQWAADGGTVIVLVEAFLENGYGVPPAQLEHAQRRSVLISSGKTRAYIAITFAAYNSGPCHNLRADDLCGIYERRPLVCRIYPMEINPHIPLRPAAKDCPPHAWEEGPELIIGSQLVDLELKDLIDRSRQADREDIAAKEAICALLGIRTTALKGDGFATYLPDMSAFAEAARLICEQKAEAGDVGDWGFQLSNEIVAGQLLSEGARTVQGGVGAYTFIPLQQVG